MKLRSIACLIGALAISSAPFVMAVSGGGFPSFPLFQGVGIGGNNSATCPQTSAAAIFCATGTVNNGEAVVANLSSGTNAVGLSVLAGTSSSNKAFRVFNSTGTNEFLDIDGAGNITEPVGTSPWAKLASANTFTANQTIAGTSAQQILNSTSAGSAFLLLQNNGTNKGLFCLSTTPNACTNGDAIGDTSLRGDATLWFSTASAGNQYASLTQAGVLNVKSGGDFQVNGTSVCLSNGVNCGPGGRVTLAWSGTCSAGGCINGILKNATSVTRNSAGNYTVNESVAIGSSSVCTATTFSSPNAGLWMHISSVLASTVNVLSVNSAGTQTDVLGFSIICMS